MLRARLLRLICWPRLRSLSRIIVWKTINLACPRMLSKQIWCWMNKVRTGWFGIDSGVLSHIYPRVSSKCPEIVIIGSAILSIDAYVSPFEWTWAFIPTSISYSACAEYVVKWWGIIPYWNCTWDNFVRMCILSITYKNCSYWRLTCKMVCKIRVYFKILCSCHCH